VNRFFIILLSLLLVLTAIIPSIALADEGAYTINATAGTGGSIDPSGAISVTSGTSQAFSITPSGGFNISDLRVDGLSIGIQSSYTFTNVTDNHTIEASFAPVLTTYKPIPSTPPQGREALLTLPEQYQSTPELARHFPLRPVEASIYPTFESMAYLLVFNPATPSQTSLTTILSRQASPLS